jgi:hypothetical protein
MIPGQKTLNSLRMSFCSHFKWQAVSEQIKYSGVMSAGNTVGSPGHNL